MRNASQNIADPDRLAHQLAADLEEAMRTGSAHAAEQLAGAIRRLGTTEATVLERLARLHYQRGEWELAIIAIDRASPRTSSLAMLRACCLVQLGLNDDARRDLASFAHSCTAPLKARLLEGLLLLEQGHTRDAIALFRQNIAISSDHASMLALITALIHADRPNDARLLINRMLDDSICTDALPGAPVFAGSIGLPPGEIADSPTSADIDMLASELLADESVLDALLAAQKIRPHEPTLKFLQRALLRCGSQFTEPVRAIEAQVCIARLLDDEPAARRWIAAGLARYPMSLTLRSLQEQPADQPLHQQRVAA